MGQAKRRGSFEQRKKQAIERERIAELQNKAAEDRRKQTVNKNTLELITFIEILAAQTPLSLFTQAKLLASQENKQ